jgi:hypothetical protein
MMYFDTKPEPLSKQFLIDRGYCCGNRCINCPYWPKYIKDNTKLRKQNESSDKESS